MYPPSSRPFSLVTLHTTRIGERPKHRSSKGLTYKGGSLKEDSMLGVTKFPLLYSVLFDHRLTSKAPSSFRRPTEFIARKRA